MHRPFVLALLASSLGVSSTPWGGEVPSAPAVTPGTSPGTVPPPSDPAVLWLDEVRAQREVAEARRRAAKGAADARLRAVDPWAAARVEAMEQEFEWRRGAARALSEQRRRSAVEEYQAHREALERMFQATDPLLPPYYTPYGWTGPWGMRGY